jgi:hypothetical protein
LQPQACRGAAAGEWACGSGHPGPAVQVRRCLRIMPTWDWLGLLRAVIHQSDLGPSQREHHTCPKCQNSAWL